MLVVKRRVQCRRQVRKRNSKCDECNFFLSFFANFVNRWYHLGILWSFYDTPSIFFFSFFLLVGGLAM